ncbi:acid phosphatase 1-like [Impatiens glandulifera]|uniref:acid phosphatase 1-like n=1 Tax=Impatiens glandulifera TaxID=253017 RepID=UPI001FB11721|nr:acid phosphatase 1-like [Impatiens glandulifera]
MEAGRCIALTIIFCMTCKCLCESVIQMSPENRGSDLIPEGWSYTRDDNLFCDSWKYTVETNSAGKWSQIPKRCGEYVKDYMTSIRYQYDMEAVAENAITFVREAYFAEDGRDAWIFDIDETLISNLPYYAAHGFGLEKFDEKSFDEWVDLAESPAIAASMKLYDELQQLGFKIFLLTGRTEHQRNATEINLLKAGFRNWDKLILRGVSEAKKPAMLYKSDKRREIEEAGYIIHGSSGDQWSDLLGSSLAIRSFKLPNPIYHIP